MKKKVYKTGDKIGEMIFIKELSLHIQPSGKTKRVALMKCACGKIEKKFLYSVRDGSIKGCKECGKVAIGNKNRKHGIFNHKVYWVWAGIKQRCTNPKDECYDRYGAKGIILQESWIDNPKAFFDYVTSLESYNYDKISIKDLTIDRIDNNLGYVEGNLRWVNGTIQNINKPLQKNNKTGLRGVSIRVNDRFAVTIRLNRVRHHVGTFKTIAEAKIARDKKLKELGIYHEYTKYEKYD